jgi:phosphate transport system protein
MPDSHHQFEADLKHLEDRVLEGLRLVVRALDQSQDSLAYQDVELAQMVVAADDRIDRIYLGVHQEALALLARRTASPEQVRAIAALLVVVRCLERMADQCVNIAKLVPLSGHESPKDKEILDAIDRMARLARSQVVQAHDALKLRDRSLAQGLVTQDAEINRVNRQIFRRAVEIGDDIDMREWGMFMILVARCLERIGDNTVDIAEQVVFIQTGVFRDLDPGAVSSAIDAEVDLPPAV